MPGVKVLPVLKRSQESSEFEALLRASSLPGVLPRVSDIDYAKFGRIADRIAILDPDSRSRSLRFTSAGEEVRQFFGKNLIGVDYLNFVDPAIKGDAFDSVFVMLTRPCGLWQMTPLETSEGPMVSVEFTLFPVFDHQMGRGQIIVAAHHNLQRIPRLVQIRHSKVWGWIGIRGPAADRG